MVTSDYFSSSPPLISLLLRHFLISCSLFAESLALTSGTAYGGRTWNNNIQSLHFLTPSIYEDALVRPILLSSNISYNDMNLQFGCGFFCYGSPCDTAYLFATFFVVYTDSSLFDMQMVWSSNREQMVQENATLTLTSKGELVLRDADGTLVWSTNTSTQAFQRMEIQESGNLVLYNTAGRIMWQSFDYPTDTLLLGQKFVVGQKFIANISPKNTSQGRFYCTLLHDSFAMFTASAPAQMYFRYPTPPAGVELSYIQFDNQSIYIYSQGQQSPLINLSIPKSCLYFKVDSDGHLRTCSVLKTTGRSSPDYMPSFMDSAAECDYPRPCGDYGVCTNGQCSCPRDGNAFKPIDVTDPNFGCVPRIPLVCSETSRRQGHHFLELEHVSFFTFVYENASMPGLVSRDTCQKVCLENCSCKAAFFRYEANFSSGSCYLESSIYSMKMNSPTNKFYNATAYIKIQSRSKRIKSLVVVIICASVGGVLALFILSWAWINKCQKSRQEIEKDEDEGEDDCVDWPAGLPLRYSFQELQDATNGFSIKLGSGGFGSVYEGVLSDGSKIAVKRLDRPGHGRKEFRAEVETLGKIDHLNLVRLKGFCAQKSHRMLVYEHLPNGSLDKWIFSNKSHQHLLDWKTISKVVLDIARGLTYLHEECQERIIHFDIKPQNILLDQNFNAKVSDFGLAKLINREQSEVVTMMRGTPGYMAPELLSMHITEKADIFSFGVMVVEIVSGKRRRELSEDSLFSVLQVKAEEGRLMDLVYPRLEDEKTSVKEEAVKMLKVGMWCVQDNFTRRPAMSIVVKALEGLIDTFNDVPCMLTGSTVASNQQSPFFSSELSCAPTTWVLSGPR